MININDVITLYSKNSFVVKVTGNLEKVNGLGVIDTKRFLTLNYGDSIEFGSSKYKILRASLNDFYFSMKRDAQIIGIKDSSRIIAECNVSSGKIVIEGGAGSGALTMTLLNAVKPHGKVITYELKDDFIKVASDNIKNTGLEEYSVIKKGEITKDVKEESDAFILDIPNPWDAVDIGKKVLKYSGYFCAYVPTVNQMEKTVKKLRKEGFGDVRAIELIEREMLVKELGSRPDNKMIGHTAYLIFGRKV